MKYEDLSPQDKAHLTRILKKMNVGENLVLPPWDAIRYSIQSSLCNFGIASTGYCLDPDVEELLEITELLELLEEISEELKESSSVQLFVNGTRLPEILEKVLGGQK